MAESFPNMDREIIEKVQATSNRINTKVFISKSILPTKVKLVNIKKRENPEINIRMKNYIKE